MTPVRKNNPLNFPNRSGIQSALRCLAAVLLMTATIGCATISRAPMDVLTYQNADQTAPHQRMFVFLRGIGGDHQCFEEQGLVADVRACNLPFDMAAPNAHLGYYIDRSLILRLKEDVIDPAKARGIQKIWLVGVSMGGLGAMLYLYEHPEDIEGVYLIAPFLGPQSILEEIDAAGGVRTWEPGAYNADDDWPRMLWHWIKTSVADHPEINIYLGYGTNDPFKSGSRLLVSALPPDRVYAIEGTHDYETFKTLWKKFLNNDAALRK